MIISLTSWYPVILTLEKFNHFSKDKAKTSSIVAEESLIDLVNFPLL